MPGVRIENGQIRRPEQLPQIAAVRNQRVPAARAEWQGLSRYHSASLLLHHEGHDARRRREGKERDFLRHQSPRARCV